VTTYLIFSSFLNFVTGLLLAFAVVLRGRKNQLTRRFGFFALSVGAWSGLYLLWQISQDADRALFLSRLLMVAAYFVPVTFLHFVVHLCGERKPWWIRFGYGIALVFIALNSTPFMVAGVKPAFDLPFWPRAGPGFVFYLVFFVIYTGEAVRLLHRQARASSGARATHLWHIFFATLIGFTGGATNFPLWYNIPVLPVGNALVFIYLVTVANAVARYQLPLATYDFVLAAVYMGISATVSVFFLLAYAVASSLQGVMLTSTNLLNGFLLGMVVSLFFFWIVPRLKESTERILEQTYLRKRIGPRNRLRGLADQICTIGAEQEIFDTTAREIAGGMGFTHLGLFIRGEFAEAYTLRAQLGWGNDGYTLATLGADTRLVRVLAQRQVPIIFDGSEVELPAETLNEIEATRKEMPFEAAFPILTEGFLLGVLVLSPRENRERYTEIDFSLLEAVCLQLGVTLRARQLERRASQTEKLISLGTLAAGLAHELRNPLVSIQTFSALLKDHGHEPEFHQEFSAIIQRDVGRIASIVENIAAFAESSTVPFGSVKIEEVINGVTEIVRPELTRSGVQFTMEEPRSKLPVHGNYSQLLQVFLNLLQNALHALEGRADGRITVTVEARTGDLPKPMLCIKVSDNGSGIDPALLSRVFEPFMTTKSTGDRRGTRGMGLGLAIVRRIIQYHQGAIEVTSELGKGTTFHVYLPVHE
jgi:two-component system nitrogen regulation sensor histidine kinase GlnL